MNEKHFFGNKMKNCILAFASVFVLCQRNPSWYNFAAFVGKLNNRILGDVRNDHRR